MNTKTSSGVTKTLFTKDNKSLTPGRREATEGGLNDADCGHFYTTRPLHLKTTLPAPGRPGAEAVNRHVIRLSLVRSLKNK